jgi:hypothetical protein
MLNNNTIESFYIIKETTTNSIYVYLENNMNDINSD